MRLSLLFEDNLELHDKDEWGEISELISDAAIRRKRDPDLEKFILDQHDPYNTYYYAKDVIKGRWIEGEEWIKKSSGLAYLYARNILKLNEEEAREWSKWEKLHY